LRRSNRFMREIERTGGLKPTPSILHRGPAQGLTRLLQDRGRPDDCRHMLSEYRSRLGRLDGATEVLPNPGMFPAMYVSQEAVLSLHADEGDAGEV